MVTPTVLGCVFCTSAFTYDLSTLPTQTFVLHSGTPGVTKGDDVYVQYLATSPCASAESDMCFGGFTSEGSYPLAMYGSLPTGGGNAPVCTGLGSLNNTVVTAFGKEGLSIALQAGVAPLTVTAIYNIVCDAQAPSDNPPEPIVTVGKDPQNHRPAFNVTWHHPSVCAAVPTPPGGCSSPAPPAPAPPICEGCLPPWRPTWSMQRSTALYACNSSGPHNVDEAAAYGITVYDWSHAKLEWVNNHPMNDDELLLQQAERVLARDPGIEGEQPRVWLYRNKIKALNWIGQVREKLDDPAYDDWFVPFNSSYHGRASNNSFHVPACDWYGDAKSGPPKCSKFYHDWRQSPTKIGAGPAYTSPAHTSPPDNVCREQCDCGATNPCAEYTFNHRNASFVEWWINEYMISESTLLHKPHAINLGWLDDGITVQGMSEGAPLPTWVEDTGSSPQDMQDHVDHFRANIGRLQREVVNKGGFYWQMIRGQGPMVRNVPNFNSNCHQPPPRNVTAAQCAATLRQWCTPKPEAWRLAHNYLVCPEGMIDLDLARDATAEFLLTRGDFAWIGYGWSGCTPEPTNRTTHKPFNSTWLRPRPALWDEDFGGAPSGPCEETEEGSEVFVRHYQRADVKWTCATGEGEINWHASV